MVRPQRKQKGFVEPAKPAERMAWLDLLRAIAVLLVIWDHFTGDLLNKLGRTWLPSTIVNDVVFKPLAITQFGGFLGVTIFFLISGYIITVVLQREPPVTFVVRRVLRIFPLLAVMVLVVVLANPPQLAGMSSLEILTHAFENLTLLNYLHSPQVVLIGVAWTLAIELTFYAVALIFKPLMMRSVLSKLFPLALVIVSAGFISTARVFGGGPYFQFTVFFLYIPIFAIGSLFALLSSKQIRAQWAWPIGLAAYGVFLLGTNSFYPQFLLPTNSYPITVAYAVVVFALAWIFRDSIPRIRFFAAVALISYSLYLVHGVIGQPVLFWLVSDQKWLYTVAFVFTVVVTGLIATLTYFVIERPANRLARRVTSR